MDMMTAIWAANKAKADIQESGGAGYTEPVTEILSTPELAEMMDNMTGFWGEGEGTVDWRKFEVGKKYTIHFDDDRYDAEGKQLNEESGDAIVCLGNKHLSNALNPELAFEDTGEDFLVIVGRMDDIPFYVLDAKGRQSCKITSHETIHPIDPKFLPAGVGGSGVWVDPAELGINITGGQTENAEPTDKQIQTMKELCKSKTGGFYFEQNSDGVVGGVSIPTLFSMFASNDGSDMCFMVTLCHLNGLPFKLGYDDVTRKITYAPWEVLS